MYAYSAGRPLEARWRPVAWLALAIMMLNPAMVLAQNLENSGDLLKPGDRIRLTVPGQPDLSRDLILDAAGQVKIEPVGTVELGGLSTMEASLLLKQKLRLFYTTLDTVNLEVVRSGELRIYVIGAVGQKGALTFNTEPSLWDVMRAIGGASDNANLREARVIREEEGQPEVYPVDLSGLMDGTNIPVFVMRDGDTLIIPTLKEGIPGTPAHDGVKVFGSVGVATVVPITDGTPLMDVLMLAGAPTQFANKKKIFWVHHDGVKNQASVVNLENFLLWGDPLGNPLVYPGDTVSVEYKNAGWARQNLPFILGSLAAMATIWLAYDRIVNDGF